MACFMARCLPEVLRNWFDNRVAILEYQTIFYNGHTAEFARRDIPQF